MQSGRKRTKATIIRGYGDAISPAMTAWWPINCTPANPSPFSISRKSLVKRETRVYRYTTEISRRENNVLRRAAGETLARHAREMEADRLRTMMRQEREMRFVVRIEREREKMRAVTATCIRTLNSNAHLNIVYTRFPNCSSCRDCRFLQLSGMRLLSKHIIVDTRFASEIRITSLFYPVLVLYALLCTLDISRRTWRKSRERDRSGRSADLSGNRTVDTRIRTVISSATEQHPRDEGETIRERRPYLGRFRTKDSQTFATFGQSRYSANSLRWVNVRGKRGNFSSNRGAVHGLRNEATLRQLFGIIFG